MRKNIDDIPDQDITSIVIRPIEEKDNIALATLIHAVFHEYDAPKNNSVYDDSSTDQLYQLFMSPNAEYWVAEVDGVVVGGCGFYPTEGLPDLCAEVVKFYLSPLARGCRIGSHLFDMIEQRAIKAGYKQLYAESFKIFSQAVSLYEKRGYKYLSVPLGNSGHQAPDIYMIKGLPQ